MKTPLTKYQFAWLTDQQPPLAIDNKTDDIDSMDLGIPAHLGEATMLSLKLSLGITLFHGIHKFTPEASGLLIPLIDFEGRHEEQHFAVQMAYGGQFCHFEHIPNKIILFRPGATLFRYAQTMKLRAYLDGSHNSEMIGFSTPESTLKTFLGEQDMAFVIRKLKLDQPPALEIHRTPIALADIMASALNSNLLGNARKLHIQGKILDFFGLLINTLKADSHSLKFSPSLPEKIRDYLRSIDGRIFTLDELSAHFRLPARHLNQAFQKQYGESISSFMSGYRLTQAKAALEQTNVPMKIVSANLGYSHVNHFITAFKRKFGMTPGSLRKTTTPT